MKQKLKNIDDMLEIGEMIDKQGACLVNYQGHHFYHCLNKIRLHNELEKSLVHIQLLTWKKGKRHQSLFAINRKSIWMWGAIKPFPNLQMLWKNIIHIYLEQIFRINNSHNI